MIGQWLGELTRQQEDRALTEKMRPGSYFADTGPCLVGVCANFPGKVDGYYPPTFCGKYSYRFVGPHQWDVEHQYDDLCERFGVDRINAAIRSRILRNRLRRQLAHPIGKASVGSHVVLAG